MSRRGGQCKVCDSGVAEIVDKLLDAKTKLRDIALQVGISKSCVHVHSQRCYWTKKAQTRRRRPGGRIIYRYPGDDNPPDGGWQPNDILIQVVYDPLVTPRIMPPDSDSVPQIPPNPQTEL